MRGFSFKLFSTSSVGLLQPFSDGLKLFTKEIIFPINANTNIFLFSPALSFILSLISWSVIPFTDGIVICDLNLGILYIFSISSLNIFGILFAGWSSNSKYAYLGALRSAAQIISYEISIGFILLNIIICSGSFNIIKIVISQYHIWYFLPLLPIFFIFCISILAETNRHPFLWRFVYISILKFYNLNTYYINILIIF